MTASTQPSGGSRTRWFKLVPALAMVAGLMVTAPLRALATSYTATVAADTPGTYWRLGEATGTAAADASANANTGTYQGAPTLAVAGAIVGDTDKGITLNGTSAYVSSTLAAQTAGSLEVWFKTNTILGGVLAGVDATQTGAGTLTEALYMSNAGTILYGVAPTITVQSTGTYKDNFWHHAVGTASGTAISLYIDGVLVQSRATALVPAAGYVRAGYDLLTGWTAVPTHSFFTGSLDEAAFYPGALSAGQVSAHFLASANLPAAPVIGTPTTGLNLVNVNWTKVTVAIGGSAILSYKVFAFQSGRQVDVSTASSAVATLAVKGLAGTYTFKVAATNSEGMGPLSALSTAAVATGSNQYAQVILGDNPTSYWRLSDPYGLTATDSSSVGTNSGTMNNGVTRAQAGVLASGIGTVPDPDMATAFDGTTASVTTPTPFTNPNNYSLEGWFKTSTTLGGVLIGFDNGTGTNDRILYLNNANNLVFGVNPGAITAITSPLTYRSQWHHVVATQSSTTGIALYVDGYLVAANGAATTAGNYTGAWRMGWENLAGWPTAPTSNFLNTTLDDVAVYPTVLTPAQILNHFQAAQANPIGPVTGAITTPGSNTAVLNWTASAKAGASSVTGYRVSAYSAGVLQATVTTALVLTATMRGLLGTYSFKITPVNSEGAGVQATFAATPTITGVATYSSTVIADTPSLWYRFSDPGSALTVADQSGGTNTGIYQGGLTRMGVGALALSTGGSADADVSLLLNGTNSSVTTSSSLTNPNPFSEEIWFKTATAVGGPLFGFDNGGAADRVLYMTNAGNLVFGVNPGSISTITSPKTYKDNFWHHAVASLGAGGMILAVDGYQVASNAAVTTAAGITGSWRIGQETLTGWPSAPTSSFLSASIDDAAIYPTQLSAVQMQAHFTTAAITAGAPTIGTATPGTNTAVVTWTAPGLVGDSAITGYRISAFSGTQLQDTVTAAAGTTSATVYGLLGTYTFTVRAVNGEGAGVASAATGSTVVSGAATFFSTGTADSPSLVYRFDDPVALALTDASASGTDTGLLVNGVTTNIAGALGSTTDADTAVTLDGTTGYVSSTQQLVATAVPFSVEVKFKTATALGGVLADLGGSPTGLSAGIDRVLYMNNAGNVIFGMNPGALQTISSPLTYRDGQWHTVSATVAAGVTKLYLDSGLVATGTTTSTSSTGYWRAGFDNLAGWPTAPTSNFFAGSIDELAVFPAALTLAQIQAHFLAGGQVPSAPGIPVLTVPQQSQMTATWTVPSSVGQSPILTYTLFASAPGLSIESITVPTGTFTAIVGGLASGTSYTFTVVATNSQGSGPGASAAATTGGTLSTYLPAILADGATQYYRLDEATGTTAWDFSGSVDKGTDTGTFTLAGAGGTASDADHSTSYNGSTGFVSTAQSVTSPAAVTVEGWFKTASLTGGVIAGFGNLASGTSTTYDRVLYVTNVGAVSFGVNTGASKPTVSSAAGYNNNQWHMAVGTLASGGAMTLYVDGLQVAGNANATPALSYAGFWRIGDQTLTGYAPLPTSLFLNGSIDEVAVMPRDLAASEVNAEFGLSGAVPGLSTGLSAAVSAQNVLVSFTAPVAVGDSPLTGYTLTALQAGTPAQTVTVAASPGLIGGLLDSTGYTITVTANNSEGPGLPASTLATTGAASAYFGQITGDSPGMGWYRLNETQGTTAFDSSGVANPNTGTYRGGFTLNSAGGIASDGADKAVLLNGTTGYISSSVSFVSPDPLSAEVWFKTASVTGGELAGMGSAQTGASGAVDRVIYMTNAGTLNFGVHPGAFTTVSSPKSYNDGQWHLADGIWSSVGGLELFVDGRMVAADATATAAATITGYWRAGYDSLTGWPSAPTSNFLSGSVDEAAFYPSVLTPAQIQSHFDGSGGAPGAAVITGVTPAATTATVTWTAPGAVGISPLLSYTVTASIASVVKQSAVVTAATTSTTLGGLTPGTAYTFVVTATNSEAATASAGAGATTTGVSSTYRQAVAADGPSLWYRLDEGSGTTAWDSSGSGNTGTYRPTVTLGAAGALAGDTDTAVQLDGTTGYVSSSTAQNNPIIFSIEAWVKTGSASGGMIAGLGASQTGLSATTDRVLYMTGAGIVVFGTNPGVAQTIASPVALNNGVWHQLVASLSVSGMVLYVDGLQVASSAATGAANMSGYWRAGYDRLSAWPTPPASNFLAGTVDELAIYPTALTLTQVQTHYRAAAGPLTLALTGVPTSFTVSGNPSSTVTQSNAVTYTVTTNDPLGYSVTVQAQAATLNAALGGNHDTIPIVDVGVRGHGGGGYTPVSASSPVTVHTSGAASAGGGDNLGDDYQVIVPWVNSDTYSVGLTYIAATN